MTSRDFCIWLKGVVVGSHHFNLTPKAWEAIRNELDLVDDTKLPEEIKKVVAQEPTWLGRDIINNPYYTINPGTTGSPNFATPTTTSTVSKKEQLND